MALLGYMPAFGSQFADTEIAEFGTYIRNGWGNDYGVLTTGVVTEARWSYSRPERASLILRAFFCSS